MWNTIGLLFCLVMTIANLCAGCDTPSNSKSILFLCNLGVCILGIAYCAQGII